MVDVWDMDRGRADAAAAKLPDAKGYVVDVTDPDAVHAAMGQVVADLGPLGSLITGAGHNGSLGPVADYPLDG